MSTSVRRSQIDASSNKPELWEDLWMFTNTVATALEWFSRKGLELRPHLPIKHLELLKMVDETNSNTTSRMFTGVIEVTVDEDKYTDAVYNVSAKYRSVARADVVVSRKWCCVVVNRGTAYEYPPTSISSILFFLMNPEVDDFASDTLSKVDVADELRAKMATWREVRDMVVISDKEVEEVFNNIKVDDLPHLGVDIELWRMDGRFEIGTGIEIEEEDFDVDVLINEMFYVIKPVSGDKYVRFFCDLDPEAVNPLSQAVMQPRQAKVVKELLSAIANTTKRSVLATVSLSSISESYLSKESR